MPRRLRSVAMILLLPLLNCLSFFPSIGAFNLNLNTNLAVYWGQDSYGGTHPSDTANWQKSLAYYCQDSPADIIPIAFLDQFNSVGGMPSINLANTCSTSNGVFPGTLLANCSFLAEDIQTCQGAGKAVTLSIGGPNGGSAFVNDSQGVAFAHTIWDLFLGGSSTTRPFGSAVLDGIDVNIQGGVQTGFVAFLTTLRDLMDKDNKPYYITAAPQCPYPDAYIGATLDTFPFDAVFVQFYNNTCGLNQYNTSDWNFGVWDNWAKTISPNSGVKVYIGAPGSPSAAPSGYVEVYPFATIMRQTMDRYTSFGGVALWDASQAYANNRYDMKIKNALITINATTTRIPSRSLLKKDVSCAGVSPWQMNVPYTGGQQVTYNGHVWTASYWSFNDVPGGAAGVWADNGLCTDPPTTTTTASMTTTIAAATTATTTTTATSTAPANTPTLPCTMIPAWQPNVAYTSGQQVSYNGHFWVAKYWTSNDIPGGAAGVWSDQGACIPSLTCVGVPAWQSNVAYAAGTQVTYNGDLWMASSWSYNDVPGDAAGVWIDTGSCTSSTSTTSSPTSTTSTTSTTTSTVSSTTATATATAPTTTSSTTVTSTTTGTSTTSSTAPTPSPTTPIVPARRRNGVVHPGQDWRCFGVQAWQSNVAYTGGQQVIYQGHLRTAQRWTHNDIPAGASGVWADNGPCH